MEAVVKVKTAVRTTTFFAALAAGLLLAGCHTPNRQVTGRVFLDRGMVSPKSSQVIWQSSALLKDSDVTVTYRGADGCPARLVTGQVSARSQRVSSKAQQTDATGVDDVTVKLRGVQSICLICGDAANTNAVAGDCAYVIEQVNHSRGARVLETKTLPGETLSSVMVAAGARPQTVWQSPIAADEGSARGCHVTLRVYGVGHCRAVLDYQLAGGVRRQMVVDEHRQLVSLINVVKVNLSSVGPAGTRCAAEVLQTDCPQ